MNKHLEIELKYAAPTLEQFHTILPEDLVKVGTIFCPEVDRDLPIEDAKVHGLKLVKNIDTFYSNGETVIRYRRNKSEDGGKYRSELTLKERFSEDSMLLRKEVNLNLGYAKSPDDDMVNEFLKSIGYQQEFSLRKDFELMTIMGKHGPYAEPVEFEVVRYDSGFTSLTDKEFRFEKEFYKSFLEVEVKSEVIGHEAAMVLAGKLGGYLSKRFKLGKPINSSLYEMYKDMNKKRKHKQWEAKYDAQFAALKAERND